MKPILKIVNKGGQPVPMYQTEGAAGLDLRADESVTLRPMERRLVSTGLYVQIPEGYEGQVRPRSGLARDSGVTVLNSPGTIDSDYRGPVKVLLVNLSSEQVFIEASNRIAQLVISPVARVIVDSVADLPDTKRGAGGFGSTGK